MEDLTKFTSIDLEDRLVRVATIKTGGKLRSFTCMVEQGNKGKVSNAISFTFRRLNSSQINTLGTQSCFF